MFDIYGRAWQRQRKTERDIERQTHTHRQRRRKRRGREREEKNAGVAGTWCHYTAQEEFFEHSFQFVNVNLVTTVHH